MDPARAISFIMEKGSSIEKARLDHILYGVKPNPDLIQTFLDLQNTEGGFPYDMVLSCPSTVASTLLALGWLDDLGLLDSPPADKALAYLTFVQKEDGGWDEDLSILQFHPPIWIKPGDLRTRLYLTSYSAYWLAIKRQIASPVFKRALKFLLRYQDQTGKFYGYPHTTWIATSVLIIAGPQYAERVTMGLRSIMDSPRSTWFASQITWALNCLGRAGLPKEHPLIEMLLDELLRRRKPNGSWCSEDSGSYPVGVTIEALKALKHYGLLLAKS